MNLMKKLLNQLQKLKEPTKVCKICLKSFKSHTFYSFVHGDYLICDECRKKLSPKFIEFKHDGYRCLALYDYDEEIKTLVYQFKGCYDIELKDVFMKEFLRELTIIYKGYTVIPIPSYKTEDIKREFNHVDEIFASIGFPMIKCLEKTENIKQSSLKKNERMNIKNYLKMSDINLVRNKKILLVDDIHTTGSTIQAAIDLISQGEPKDIKVLVIAKTKDDKRYFQNNA